MTLRSERLGVAGDDLGYAFGGMAVPKRRYLPLFAAAVCDRFHFFSNSLGIASDYLVGA